MKHLILFLTLLSAAPCLRAAAAVTDVWSAQIPGTHQVRITYTLTAAAPCTVSVQAWIEGHPPLDVPATALSGDISTPYGNLVGPGSGKSITLTVAETVAGVITVKAPALQNTFTKNLRFKVLATESTGPAIYGDMVRIEGGPFQMGDQSNPLAGYSNELPVHPVQVSTFYMGRYEVTKELWDEVRAWGLNHGYTGLAAGNGSYASKGVNHPVHSIYWYDMVKWCNARTEYENASLAHSATPCYTVNGVVYRTGNSTPICNWSANGYRLPTEAEWEKAARGRLSEQNFPLGNTIGHSNANYRSSSYSYEDDPKNQGYHPDYTAGGYPYTAPVNSFTPNGYGLYNMSGNVWEWCWDWHGGYTAALQTDPHGPVSGSYRVRRGGSWDSYANGCRVTHRFYVIPGATQYYVGFRLARSSVP